MPKTKTSPSVTIRVAVQADLPQLEQLMFELHDFHHQANPTHIRDANTIMEAKRIEAYLHEPDCLVYVAEEGDLLVGFITGHFCELVSVVSKSVQMGSVDELFVRESYRQLSVASQLFQTLETRFVQYGVRQVFVEVWHFNQAAVRFYDRVGFRDHIHWLCKTLDAD